MTLSSLVLVLGLAAAGNERVIDDFNYADAPAAQQAWKGVMGTAPVETTGSQGRRALKFTAPFASAVELQRTAIDRDVKLDLSGMGEFALQVAAEKPEAVGSVSLYFRSGKGWYSAGTGLQKAGPQTLRFSKASFQIEDRPTGWHAIDGIRISIWRGQPVDSAVYLGKLAAVWHDVALVIPAAGEGNERETREAIRTADSLSAMLDELGLGADAVEDAALVKGALGERRVAILANNPRLSEEAEAALVRFVEGGGKVFACYQLPPRLGAALGFERDQYIREERPGQFAEIRFDADIPGLPAAVKQASWNVALAKPAGPNARVIGNWYDDRGQSTGTGAMLLSDRGAYFSHIVLGDDRAGKRQMLAAVLGRLEPKLWQQMAEAALARAGQVGHLESPAAVADLVKKQGNDEARKRLGEAMELRHQAEQALARGNRSLPKAVELARQAHAALSEAYLRAQPSPTAEGRAWWNHSGTGAYTGDWERSAKELSAAGFNMIIPNMLWGGLAHYASDVLPRSRTFDEHGDQIAQCVEACRKHGLEVHVWKVNWNLSNAPREFVSKMRDAGRTQVTNAGEAQDWLCPSHPENQTLELESMLEVARKYEVDGLHFDYIRYPGEMCCYCDGCRERFQAQTGVEVGKWPEDCHSGSLKKSYRDWRCEQITRLVAAVHREAKKIKPGIKISAAVFSSYPDCRTSVGQDWVAWVEAGYLDFLCPMDYTEGDMTFNSLVSNQLRLVGGRVPMYPGIGATASRSQLTADRVAGQIDIARKLGAQGFTIFNYQPGTAESIVPGIGLGIGAKKAIPPHAQ